MSPDFKVAITETGWEASVRIAGLKSGDLEITLEGHTMRVMGKQRDSQDSFAIFFDVPGGFDKNQARAAYLNGELRILVPKLPRNDNEIA